MSSASASWTSPWSLAIMLLLVMMVMFGGHWHVAISASESGTGIDGIARSNRRAQPSPTALVLFSPRAAAVECVQWRWNSGAVCSAHAPHQRTICSNLVNRSRKKKRKRIQGVEGEVSDAKGGKKTKGETRHA